MPSSPATSTVSSIEEHVIALHDFSSNNATCLSFQQGQIIKVYTRDDSGWWDGEIDGNRGWFPSNYVDESGISIGGGAGGSPVGGGTPDMRSSSQLPSIQTEEDYSENERKDVGYSNDREREKYLSYVTAPNGIEAAAAASSSTSTSKSYSKEKRRPPSPPLRNRNYSNSYQNQTPDSPSSVNSSNHQGSSYSSSGVVDPIVHAIALLHNAARAHRVAHFQPSTSCVISSVRSVLSATDCLTRESPVLQAHPILGKERKQILSELSRLVNQSRKASAHMDREVEWEREREMDSMLSMADQVLKNVRRFLEVAIECGVDVPNRRSSVYDDLIADDRRRPSASGSVGSSTAHHLDRNEEDKTPTPDSPKSAYTYVTAHTNALNSPRSARFNLGKSRSHRSSQSDEEDGDVDNGSGSENRKSGPFLLPRSAASNRPSSKLKPQDGNGTSNSGSRIRSGSTSEDPMESAGESLDSTSRSGSGSGSSDSVNEPVTPGPSLRSPLEVILRVREAESNLLSLVAAFIGHAHTHTRDSPGSSFAHLIKTTTETVEGARELLTVIEAVRNNPQLQASHPNDMQDLWIKREGLYEATTALVTAVRLITSPNPPNSVTSTPSISSAYGEDDDKTRLLETATSIYRTGQECAKWADFYLKRADPGLLILLEGRDLLSSSGEENRRTHESSSIQADGNDLEREEEGSTPGGKRNNHTLSFLGRKATSLSCLKERYENPDYVNSFGKVDESDGEDGSRGRSSGEVDGDGDVSRDGRSSTDSTRRIESTPTPNGIGPHDPARDSFTSSRPSLSERRGVSTPTPLMGRARASTTAGATRPQVPGRRLPPAPESYSNGEFSESESISRDHSVSTAVSTRSTSTIDTSARPSMEHPDSDPFPASSSIELPHTAPLPRNLQREVTDQLSRRGVSEQTRHYQQESSSPTPSSISSFPSGGRFRSGTMDDRSLPSLPPMEAKFMAPEFDPTDVSYNSEGQVTGATLEALVEKIAPHDTTPDNTFSRTFFLCFRLFTTPLALFEILVARYNLQPPTDIDLTEEELDCWNEKKATPIRVRTLNVFKTWLETHWHPPTDHVVLDGLIEFLRNSLPTTGPLARQGQRLADLAQKRIISGPLKSNALGGNSLIRPGGGLQRAVSTDRLKTVVQSSGVIGIDGLSLNKGNAQTPAPTISKAMLLSLRASPATSINVTDFDPLELARQLTLMESKVYCAISPEELLGQEFSKKAGVSNAVHVKSMSSLSTHITGWISACILGEGDARKRTQLVKFFVKLGDVSVPIPLCLERA